MKTYTAKELKAMGLTLREIGEATGFHFTTVEKAIKGFPRVGADTRKKIIAFIQDKKSQVRKLAKSE